MYKQFPFSMENIPRHSSFGCLSLKFGTIISALLIILYSVLALAQCLAALSWWSPKPDPDNEYEPMLVHGIVVIVTIVHIITLFLSAIMLVGALREDSKLMKPWVIWMSLQVMTFILLFIFFTSISMINNFYSSLLVYVTEFISLIVRCYMLILVASYYKQLEEERDERRKIKSLISTDIWTDYA